MTSIAANRPHRLGPNKVPVYYKGGAGIDRFRREVGQNGPEDWVASFTSLPPAFLPAGADLRTGISRFLDGTPIDEVVRADAPAWLGPVLAARFGAAPGLLVKI